jgi:hypothetical protein
MFFHRIVPDIRVLRGFDRERHPGLEERSIRCPNPMGLLQAVHVNFSGCPRVWSLRYGQRRTFGIAFAACASWRGRLVADFRTAAKFDALADVQRVCVVQLKSVIQV